MIGITKTLKQFFLLGLLILPVIFFTTNAPALSGDDYDSCISNSGGHGDISSVQWTCSTYRPSTENDEGSGNVCSLWIADDDSTDTDIYVEKTTGSVNLKYWGMCYVSPAKTGLIRVTKDNGAFNDNKELNRGNWGSPNSITATMDIDKFKQHLTPDSYIEGNTIYNEYSRTVTVGRCYEGQYTWDTTDGVCSEMDQDITLTVKEGTFNFKGKADVSAVSSSESSTSSWSDSNVNGSNNKITILCSNNGCNTTFNLGIQRTGIGGQNTFYQIESCSVAGNSNSECTYGTVPGGVGWAPGGDGETSTTVGTFTPTLQPGTTTCYRVKFNRYSSGWKERSVAACAYAKPVLFEGYSSVYLTNTPGTSASTGWKNSGDLNSNTAWLELPNGQCNGGCDVTFTHGIAKTQGLNSAYSTWDIAGTGATSSSKTYPTSSPSSSPTTIKTGQIACSKLTFDRKISYDSTQGRVVTTRTPTRACVYATGTYGSTIDVKAKKSTSSSWLEAPESSPIYAKPTDIINFYGAYTPKDQPTATFKPNAVKIGSTTIPNGGTSTANNNGTQTIQSIFDTKVSPVWNNAFSINLNGNQGAFDELAKAGTIGQATSYNTSRNYTIDINDPGHTLTAKAITNNIQSTKTTPKAVTFSYIIGTGFTATVNNDPLSDSSFIKVPYNFNNSTCIKNPDTDKNDDSGCQKSTVDEEVYAGETKTINYLLKVKPRTNNTVGDTYATLVRGAKWKLRLCINGTTDCVETSEKTDPNNTPLNSDGLLTGDEIPQETAINIPDVPAGTRVCISSAIYPTSVKNDTDLDASGNGTWGYSSPVCYTVAKRPSLQIWGGNVYSNGQITTNTSTKGPLDGYNTYDIEGDYTKRAFGSWTELGIISSGTIKGFSSGASLGYASNNGTLSPNPFIINNSITSPDPGGSTQLSVCNRSPLTFANKPCTNNTVGNLGNSIASGSTNDDKATIINQLVHAASAENRVDGDQVTLNDPSKITDNIYYYYNSQPRLFIPTTTIQANTTQVIHSTSNIIIKGDLTYDNSTSYASFFDLPKLVIYAENDIYIDCNVSHIDAILVAENRVITCANEYGSQPDANSADRSRQLTITGTVITDKFIPNRTYGAATGANSIVPAEIINFDPSLYLWESGSSADTGGSSVNMDINYRKELAPRY